MINNDFMFDALPDDVNLIIVEMVAGMLLSDQLSKENLCIGPRHDANNDWVPVAGDHASVNELIRLSEEGYTWRVSVYETIIKCFDVFANMLGTYIFWLPQDVFLYEDWMTGIQSIDERIARSCFTEIIEALVLNLSKEATDCNNLRTYLNKNIQGWQFQVCLNTNEDWISGILSDLADLVVCSI